MCTTHHNTQHTKEVNARAPRPSASPTWKEHAILSAVASSLANEHACTRRCINMSKQTISNCPRGDAGDVAELRATDASITTHTLALIFRSRLGFLPATDTLLLQLRFCKLPQQKLTPSIGKLQIYLKTHFSMNWLK